MEETLNVGAVEESVEVKTETLTPEEVTPVEEAPVATEEVATEEAPTPVEEGAGETVVVE